MGERHAIFQRQQDGEVVRSDHVEVRPLYSALKRPMSSKRILKSIVPPLLWNIGRNSSDGSCVR